MAPGPAPSEIDVFSGPHSRMKRLVQLYSERLSEVDVSSCSDLRALLWNLRATFSEFKTHEHIENECIMWRLKNRLQFLKVEIKAVSEVHSDNKLSEMVQLVESACLEVEGCHCPREAACIGHSLIAALRKFTEDFLPHMQEEEEIFQPLLMEYFSYNELKEIKSDVIEKHQKLTKYCPEEKKQAETEGSSGDGSNLEGSNTRTVSCSDEAEVDADEEWVDEEEEENTLSKIQGLPAEVLLEIFSLLSPRDLSQCSMVCSRWSGLARDPSLWRLLYPALWAKGNWQYGASIPLPESENAVDCTGPEGDVYVVVDEDADFDESASSSASAVESDASNASMASYRAECIRNEARMLVGMARHLLPFIGEGVETLVLAGSKGVTNGLVYKLLKQCPNLQYIDLSETKVSDIAFKGLDKSGVGCKLRHVDLSGCTNISDTTLHRLASIQPSQPSQPSWEQQTDLASDPGHHTSDKNGRPILGGMPHDRTLERQPNHHSSDIGGQRPLPAGCAGESQGNVNEQQHHTDTAPRTKRCQNGGCERGGCRGSSQVQDSNGGRPLRNLEFLSLSGCYRITDHGLRLLSQGGGWPHLSHLDLSGCLNVSGAGLSLLAGVCPTLEHETFFYCDNIEEGPYADTASGCQNLQCGKRVCCRSGE